MMKREINLLGVVMLFCLVITIAIQPISATDPLVGVEVGDSFQLKVVENSLDPSVLGLDLDEFSDVNFADLSLDQINIDVAGLIPDKGEVVGIEVTSLPSESENGAIKFQYWNTTETVETNFYIGTPVVTINWTYWSGVIDDVIDQMGALDNVYAVTLLRDFNSTYFTNHAYIKITVSDDSDNNEVGIYQKMVYETDTGILERLSIKLEIDTGTEFGDIEQYFTIEQTDEAVTTEPPANSESSEDDELTPGFELIVLIVTLPSLIALKKKKDR